MVIKRLNAWRYRRHLAHVARWEKTRARGKARFVIRGSLLWSGAMIVFSSLYDWYFRGGTDLWQTIYFVIPGPILGLVSWWINEGVFRAARIDARMPELGKDGALHKG